MSSGAHVGSGATVDDYFDDCGYGMKQGFGHCVGVATIFVDRFSC